jgi:hypothetical protein
MVVIVGGRGSGRRSKIAKFVAAVATDDDFKQCIAEMTVSQYAKVVDKMYQKAIGNHLEEIVNRFGERMIVPISSKDSINAARVWKELTLDKFISDRKIIEAPLVQSSDDEMQALKEIEDLINKKKLEKEEEKATEGESSDGCQVVKLCRSG